ncbi:hypothetical protein [Nocardia salmonicida]|uniref:hypothetical protein n=1 Tax=Nocardia salmonicida TaxID=53431 RepID=UPI0007A4C1B2|nr:hypothetical protein [Nocardia salmonicida]MBC7299829.1 hypothetical protein [Nocardia sp.]
MNTIRYNVTRHAAFSDASGTLVDTVAVNRTASEVVAYLDTIISTPARPGRIIHDHSRFWNVLTRYYTDGFEEFSIVPSNNAHNRDARRELMEAALHHRWPGLGWQLVDIGEKTHVHWHGALAPADVADYLAVVCSRSIVLHRRQPGNSDPDRLVDALAAKHAEIDELVRAYQADPGAENDGARTASHNDRHAELTSEALDIAEQIIANAELGRIPTTWMHVPPS